MYVCLVNLNTLIPFSVCKNNTLSRFKRASKRNLLIFKSYVMDILYYIIVSSTFSVESIYRNGEYFPMLPVDRQDIYITLF